MHLNLASVYDDLHEDDKAIEEYQSALRLAEQLWDQMMSAAYTRECHTALAKLYERKEVSSVST